MNFIQHDFPPIEQINSDTGRRYKLPDGSLVPSVTTVLSVNDGAWLQEWRDKVGAETANKISTAAARKGTRVHEACENYIRGIETVWSMYEAETKEAFSAFIPVLEKIDSIHAMESRMYSTNLSCAGTVDLIAVYDGKICIMDWKTSRQYKNRADIPNYFMQLAAYAIMFRELTGIMICDLCIQMTVADYGLLTYWEKTIDWVPKFIEVRAKFREIHEY